MAPPAPPFNCRCWPRPHALVELVGVRIGDLIGRREFLVSVSNCAITGDPLIVPKPLVVPPRLLPQRARPWLRCQKFRRCLCSSCRRAVCRPALAPAAAHRCHRTPALPPPTPLLVPAVPTAIIECTTARGSEPPLARWSAAAGAPAVRAARRRRGGTRRAPPTARMASDCWSSRTGRGYEICAAEVQLVAGFP